MGRSSLGREARSSAPCQSSASAFYVLYGDSYLPIDYRKAGVSFIASGKEGLMTVFENRGQFDSSNVWFEDGAILAYDKGSRLPQMQHIDYGLGVFRGSAFDGFPRDEVGGLGRGPEGPPFPGTARGLRDQGALLRDRLPRRP